MGFHFGSGVGACGWRLRRRVGRVGRVGLVGGVEGVGAIEKEFNSMITYEEIVGVYAHYDFRDLLEDLEITGDERDEFIWDIIQAAKKITPVKEMMKKAEAEELIAGGGFFEDVDDDYLWCSCPRFAADREAFELEQFASGRRGVGV
jgi:hypothetical protein